MPSVSPGDVVAGKYRVERKLGSGGMGYVVAARHIELDQLVAIKFLNEGALADDAEAHARFRREARSTVRLKSEHIAKVHDVGVHDTDEPFIVMDYLEGQDLGAIAQDRGRIPIAEACDYVLQACEALAEAHAAGVIHRDIKPANLFVTKSASGRPLLKVLDFGISKITDAAGLEVTHTEMLLGSPKFMSPEQMRDPRGVDGRTDIWALGVVLYRLVSGRAPFDGDSLARVCSMVLAESPVALSSFISDLPPGFEEVVAYCLAKDRTYRYADVAALAAAVAAFTSDVEAAAERVRDIAAVLGVATPPVVVSPSVAPSVASRESFPATVLAANSSRISIHASWSPPTGETPFVRACEPSARHGGVATVILAAVGVVMFLAGLAVFQVSSSNAAVSRPAAANAPRIPAVAPAVVPAVAPAVVPSAELTPVSEPPVSEPQAPPQPATTAAPAASEAHSASVAKPTARTGPPRKTAPRTTPKRSEPEGTIPGDRR